MKKTYVKPRVIKLDMADKNNAQAIKAPISGTLTKDNKQNKDRDRD